MVMTLFRGMCYPGPQYSVAIALGMHMLRVRNQAKQIVHSGPLLVLAFSRSSHSAIPDPEQENNQMTPDKSQVPQADPSMTGLHNSNQRQDREKVTDHMRDKYAKNIKLEYNSMNIIAYRARQNEHMTPPEPAPQVG
jgi:hypothetical protein